MPLEPKLGHTTKHNKGMAYLSASRHRQILVLTLGSVFIAYSLMLGQVVAAIARGYTTNDEGLQVGMVAALSKETGESTDVERAAQETADQIVGIVTTVDNSLVTVSSGGAKVLVESEGQIEGYVSDINGTVEKGDLLIVSPLKGVLMKSGDLAGVVVGIAAEKAEVGEQYEYEKDGATSTTRIDKIKIDLSSKGTNGTSGTDSSLSRLGRTLVGKPVSDLRVIVSLVIFLVVLMAEGGIIYGAISSSITSLGRNPLAHNVIKKELVKVGLIALMVLGIGVAAMYAVLWF